MLYKPEGYVCSHDDGDYPTIYQFFDYPIAAKLHCAGRLDVDTTGLVLLTDDGQWSHRVTSPKHRCDKTYLVTLADPVEDFYQAEIEKGILLRGEKTPTKPATLEILDDYNVNLTISEDVIIKSNECLPRWATKWSICTVGKLVPSCWMTIYRMASFAH